MKIGILADLTRTSGLGHFKRMLGLSEELERLKHKCFFIIDKSSLIFTKERIGKKVNFLTIKNNSIQNFLNIINKESIETVIFDTYKKKYLIYEKKLKQRKIKIVAIDDYLYNHSADFTITNREFVPNEFLKKNKRLFTGFKYALTSNIKENKFKKKQSKKFKILFHAGGNEDYKNFGKFFSFTLDYLDKLKNVNVTFLTLTNETKKYLKFLKKKNNLKKRFNFLNYKENFTKHLRSFDIVCGPLGTTTFETILAGSFPYTFLRQKVSLDPFSSWLKNGHLINLNRNEIVNKRVITNTWDFTFKNFKMLKKILIDNSKDLDGKANKRVAEIITGKHIANKISFRQERLKKNKIEIKKCGLMDARKFLELRNKPNNKQVSTSNRNIIWPEHINWFLNKNIKKFKLIDSNSSKLFFWFKVIKDKFGKIIISGIITEKKNDDELKYVGIALKKLNYLVRKSVKDATWIVFNKKKNLIFERFNANMGFKSIRKNNLLRLKSLININSNIFSVSELKI